MQKLLKGGIRLLIILILIGLIPVWVSAKGQIPEKNLIETKENQMTPTEYYYDGYLVDNVVTSYYPAYGSLENSYLINNGNNTKSLLEANEFQKIINIETYNDSDEQISKKEVAFELPLFGAFYSGLQYNYIAYGQENKEENNTKEVIRIVKYDKSFNRIDSVSLSGGETFTVIPFDAGHPSMCENGNELVLHTSRERYTTSDGLNHQSQLTVIVDTATMSVTNYTGEWQTNHVSHSFSQYVRFDGNDHVLIDHGDGYPRSIVLNKEMGSHYLEKNLFEIVGETGENYTGVSLGGFEVSSSSYIAAINSYEQSSSSYLEYIKNQRDGGDLNRDIILCVLPKNNFQEANQITLAKYIGTNQKGSIPKLVKISDSKLMVLWQEFNIKELYPGFTNSEIADLKYVIIDSNGVPASAIQSVSGYKLSTSSPIIIGDDVVWCTHENDVKKFYTIPLSGSPKISVSSFTANKESGQTAGTPIALTARAIGGTGSYQYKFYYTNELQTSVIQDFSSSDTANFVADTAGNYTLWVDVKDSSGKTATKSIENFQVTEAPKPTVKSFETDKVSGQFAKTSIKLRAEGNNGRTPYEYKFYYRYGTETITIQDFSTANTADFKPAQAGTYAITVDVKDAKGDIASKTIENYQILEPEREISTSYTTHVQNVGWQDWIHDGAVSGTVGQGLRLEGIRIYLITKLKYDLDVSYSTHIQNIGWQEPKNFGFISGTTGQGLRLEAIKMNLTGSDADQFDIYYQVHAENFGWLDWAKNGENSGTAGFGYRLEGIRILVVPKGDPAPGSTARPFMQN